VRDVEALDAQRGMVLDLELQRLDEGAGARLLRPFLGEELRQAKRRALLAHVQPRPTLVARLVLHRDAAAASRDKGIDELPVDGVADDEQRRRRGVEIVPGDERLEDADLGRLRHLVDELLGVDRLGDVLREVRSVAEMAAPATIARLTQARPPPTATARMSASRVGAPVLSSTDWRCSTRASAPIRLRSSAAASNSSAFERSSICRSSSPTSSFCSPRRKASACATSRAYSLSAM
jgi:hypothetical protein